MLLLLSLLLLLLAVAILDLVVRAPAVGGATCRLVEDDDDAEVAALERVETIIEKSKGRGNDGLIHDCEKTIKMMFGRFIILI